MEIELKTFQLANELIRAMEIRDEVVEAILQVENPTERYLLELRYICLYPWGTIAKRLNYSLDHVFTLHRQALKNFAKSSL